MWKCLSGKFLLTFSFFNCHDKFLAVDLKFKSWIFENDEKFNNIKVPWCDIYAISNDSRSLCSEKNEKYQDENDDGVKYVNAGNTVTMETMLC